MINTSIIQLKDEDIEAVDRVRDYYLNNLSYGWKSNINKSYDFGHWNREILFNCKAFPFDIAKAGYFNNHPELEHIWSIVENAIGSRALLRCYINGYTYGTDAYAHQDDPWIRENKEDAFSETVIVYLNKTWNKDWQGETVIFNEEDEIETSVLPKYGRILIFDSSKFHAARSVSRACGELRSVLVFKTFDQSLLSEEAKFIFELSGDNKHSGKSFFQHLFNTAMIIERSKQPKHLIAAALFHSVYETEFYKYKGKKPSRKQIENLIGKDAEALVYEFCSLKNRFETIYNNTKDYEKSFHKDLVMLELANLHEQNTSNKYTDKINKLRELLKTL